MFMKRLSTENSLKFGFVYAGLTQHFMKQPIRNVLPVLVTYPDSQDHTVREEFPPCLMFFRADFFKMQFPENLAEFVIRVRGHV